MTKRDNGGMVQPTTGRPCPSCQASIPARATFCAHCGGRLRGVEFRPPRLGAMIASAVLVLIALPFGFIGGGCAVIGFGESGADGIIVIGIGLTLLAVAVGLCLLAGWLMARWG